MSEQVQRLEEGPWQHKHVLFRVSQAAQTPRFQLNDGVLLQEMR